MAATLVLAGFQAADPPNIVGLRYQALPDLSSLDDSSDISYAQRSQR